jgi:hypothetical protein
VGANQPRLGKARWHVDGTPERERDHSAHTGNRHEAAASSIFARYREDHPMQDIIFGQERGAHAQQRLNDGAPPWLTLHQFSNARLKADVAGLAYL